MYDRKKPLVANKESSLECRCQGSRPAPIFRWFVDDREVDNLEGNSVTLEKKDEWTSSVIKFVPKPDDNGKYMVCKASNEYYPNQIKEDGYIINVQCE